MFEDFFGYMKCQKCIVSISNPNLTVLKWINIFWQIPKFSLIKGWNFPIHYWINFNIKSIITHTPNHIKDNNKNNNSRFPKWEMEAIKLNFFTCLHYIEIFNHPSFQKLFKNNKMEAIDWS